MSELIGLGDLIEDYLGAREAAKALTGDTPVDEFDRIEARYEAAKARLNAAFQITDGGVISAHVCEILSL